MKKSELRQIIREEIKSLREGKWEDMSYDERVDYLLQYMKDPDDAEKYADRSLDSLPSYVPHPK